MKYLKKFNEDVDNYQEPFIYKSPEGLVQDIEEIFYILSDYGCELEYDDTDYQIDINIIPIEINKSFTEIDGLVTLRNRLKEDNDYIYASKLIEVFSHLNQLKEEKGGFEFEICNRLGNSSALNLDDIITVEFNFDHDKWAILNDINSLIYLNDGIIIAQLKYINDSAEYDGYECTENSFFVDFFLNKKYPTQPFLDHFYQIMGEYFKFYLDREKADDFKESGDYYYHLKGDLIKGKMAPC